VVGSNTAGKLTMAGVAPGDYRLFAREVVPNGAWQNAEFISMYEEFETLVRVSAGIRNDLQLCVIPLAK
jgi:hypothetical protein